MTMLRAENIAFSYTDASVLDEVSFSVAQGSWCPFSAPTDAARPPC